jgi:lipid-binding SYLF domain-containing protein
MEAFRKQPSLEPYFTTSYGCAVFPTIAKGGAFFVGGAYGKGDIYTLHNNQEKQIAKVELVQASVGWILGGEAFSQIIFFETEADYSRFMAGNFQFEANAKAVALSAAVSANATTMGNQGIVGGLTQEERNIPAGKLEYTKGMKVFTVTMGGLMYEATIGGQKFIVKK